MSLMKYNPAQMSPAERAKRFAGREADLKPLLDILHDNTARSANQHVLVTGPRGIGKTTLLLRVADTVREDPSFSRCWFPIVASEETYRVSSIGEFWLEMLFHLSRTTGDIQHSQAYESLRAEKDDRRLAEAARGALLDFSRTIDRRLVLVVENLQMLFDEQMSDADNWALRETLIGESRIMLLASAVSSFNQIENPNAAMFELFLVRPLAPLNTSGCQRLWQTLTGQSISRKRIRPLEILTGGNPRLLVILSEFAANTSFGQLMGDLVDLIDDHTDYLKSTTEALPPVERKVFVSLAELWRDSTAADVAVEARLDVNITSAQLIRLEKRGAVIAQRKGRTKLYRLAERLYNIYHLMRRHGAQEARVLAAVEFMSVYYEADAIPVRLQHIAQEAAALPSGERGEHFMAIERIISRSEFQPSRAKIASTLFPSISTCDDVPESLRRSLYMENPEVRISTAKKAAEIAEISDDDLLGMPTQSIVSPNLLARRAQLLRHDNPDESVACLHKALSMDSSSGSTWMLLSSILHDLGKYEETFEATLKAVTIHRELAAAHPDAFLPDLAGALYNFGICLHDLGRREEASEATWEAAEIYRKLAAAHPDTFLPGLARSLNNSGNLLGDLGRREGALEATREAVQIYRELVTTHPDAHRPGLAMSLNNLGYSLCELRLREEALETAREATEIYRKLAAARPDAYLPGLAMSLNNLGNCLLELGLREQALETAREAAEICRKLAAAHPDAFSPDLAGSLNNLGNRLGDLGLREEALEAAREAAEIYRKLAAVRPDTFHPNLAMSLNNLGNRLGDLGRKEEALEAAREAVDIYRKLATARPDAFLPNLAMSLNNLGIHLGDLGRKEEAPEAAREAVEIYRKLAAARPDAFLSLLSRSLNNLSRSFIALDREDEAQTLLYEAFSADRKSLPVADNLIGLLLNRSKTEEAFQVYESVIAHKSSYSPTDLLSMISTTVKMVADGKGARALEIIQSSAATNKLEPLIVGLQRYLGIETLAPPEIEEIAKDIVRDISELKARKQR